MIESQGGFLGFSKNPLFNPIEWFEFDTLNFDRRKWRFQILLPFPPPHSFLCMRQTDIPNETFEICRDDQLQPDMMMMMMMMNSMGGWLLTLKDVSERLTHGSYIYAYIENLKR